MTKETTALTSKVLNATVVVTAFGYAIDLYDYFIFNATRTPSLAELGVNGDALTSAGLFINNCQLFGLFLGSILWGMLGDKYGRKVCLFASILTYSIATAYCSFVESIDLYALARFFAGLGVAGELGMGLTLISEKIVASRRGYGTAFFIIVGFFGILTAALVAEYLPWRQAYLFGGIAGFILLIARTLVLESGMYQAMRQRSQTGNVLGIIFKNPTLLRKYLASIFLLVPSTFTPQILWTLSPELAKAQGIAAPIKANITLLVGYSCVIFGDFLATILSEKIHSRKKAILIFYCIGIGVFIKYIFVPAHSMIEFYFINSLLGMVFGMWVVLASLITEQVGTNIRSTIATTTPNFARTLVIPMNLAFAALKPTNGATIAVGIIGFTVYAAALWGWFNVEETYGNDLNYEEH